ncbi:MAG: hypothetical protein HFF36_06330 [Coprobacillus sp.]|nr:hypothetical protein [Coprobacillus sp.]
MRKKIENKLKKLETRNQFLDEKISELQNEKNNVQTDIKRLQNALVQLEKIESDTNQILNK